ncbi:MAG: hypothetical protein ACTHNU_11080 [Gaiellales bacterium]
MQTILDLASSVPPGNAYIRLIRCGITYTGGPYPSRRHASESAARLFLHVPDVTTVTVVRSPVVAPLAGGRHWYARAIFKADGYTAIAGPFVSRKQARAHLDQFVGRAQVGAAGDWDVCYRYAPAKLARPG